MCPAVSSAEPDSQRHQRSLRRRWRTTLSVMPNSHVASVESPRKLARRAQAMAKTS
jgi:hypothetical protein